MELSIKDRNELVLKYMGFVGFIAKGYPVSFKVSYQDHVNSGVVGLIDAIDKYDERKGAQLKTYAEWRIRGAIKDNLRRVGRGKMTEVKKDNPIELVEYLEDYTSQQLEIYPQENIFIKNENEKKLKKVIKTLVGRDAIYIKLYLKDKKQVEMAGVLKVTPGRVSQISTKINKKIKKRFLAI